MPLHPEFRLALVALAPASGVPVAAMRRVRITVGPRNEVWSRRANFLITSGAAVSLGAARPAQSAHPPIPIWMRLNRLVA